MKRRDWNRLRHVRKLYGQYREKEASNGLSNLTEEVGLAVRAGLSTFYVEVSIFFLHWKQIGTTADCFEQRRMEKMRY